MFKLVTMKNAAAMLALFLMWGGIGLLSITVPIEKAHAHGERNQEPFLRMRTLHWYDVEFSHPDKTTFQVNDLITITGKFRLFSKWPNQLPDPEKIYLNLLSAGAAFTKVEAWVNEESAVQSFEGELGRDYEFKVVGRARWEGTWHVHPMVNVLNAGGLVGPGLEYTIEGSYTDYKQPATTISGLEIDDISTFGLERVYTWHALWAVLALFWIIWWIRRPLLIPRYLMAKHGDYEDVLVTKTDRIVTAALIIVVLGLVIGSMISTNKDYPRTITLQAGLAIIPPLEEANPITIKMKRGLYFIPGRTVIAKVLVTNNQERPIRLGEFTSANLRFLDRTVIGTDDGASVNFPKELVAEQPLIISDNSPILPGDSRLITIEATDAAWEVERLSSLLNDPESTLGAMLFFFDDEGTRYITELFGNMIPVFKKDE